METGLTLTLHGVQITISLGVLMVLMREHKVWVRMKDRINTLWRHHCSRTGDDYVPLENGK